MDIQVIQEVTEGSKAGFLTFPQVVGKLMQAGFESYQVDLIRRENRFYLPNGETHVIPVKLDYNTPAQPFSASSVLRSIRAIQAGQSNYQKFMCEIAEAGCVSYTVYLTGKQVIYFGRNGDHHIELFPNR